ncbi:hypothetical protein HMPREF3218_0201881 [Prevotella bivia]|nr:hypothetical protein HMPREF3218_0201881 [Prevotella bivia]
MGIFSASENACLNCLICLVIDYQWVICCLFCLDLSSLVLEKG